ncbi:MAG: hypothetical protein JO257_33930 [Deltaproteobacteria bacterium]|nr:hypothetical protein [Deltaproteobacteria bacterium]
MRAVLVVALCAGCAVGAPPGFSAGETWTFPLVDPLADGRLLVPVMVHDHGPYLFEIDRDSSTVIDPTVAVEAGVRIRGATRMVDHDDTGHASFWTELTELHVGDLTISLVPVAFAAKPNLYDRDGRRIYGVLGRDLVADSLVFGFDRDRGIAWLQTQQAFHPPAGARTLELERLTSDGYKVNSAPVVRATVGGKPFDLHPRFAFPVGEIPRDRWRAAAIEPRPAQVDMPDWSGTRWTVQEVGMAPQVTVDGVTAEHVAFASYEDKRGYYDRYGGVLGMNFFRAFAVAADWHHHVLYLTPRADPVQSRALRIARWGKTFADCADAACVQVELVPPHDDAPTRPVLSVKTSEALTHDVEITVRAIAKSGERLANLEVNFPAGVHGISAPLDPSYLDASLTVVDLSPFPRMCEYQGGCVMTEAAASP